MEKTEAEYKKYLTATEKETLVYLEEIKSAAKLRHCEHIKLLATDLRQYITDCASNRGRNRNRCREKKEILQ